MALDTVRCVLLADRHHGLSEGIRGLLESEFEAVVMVADETSLMESARRLQPSVVIADLALARGGSFAWLFRLREQCPASPIILLSVHDEPSVLNAAFEAGASGVVRKRDIASELLEAVTAVRAGRRYAPLGYSAAIPPVTQVMV